LSLILSAIFAISLSVVNPVEELLQIEVHHPAVSVSDVLLRRFYHLMRRAPGGRNP
jgi:hypothetical protein